MSTDQPGEIGPLVEWTGDMDTMPAPPWMAWSNGRLILMPLAGPSRDVTDQFGRNDSQENS